MSPSVEDSWARITAWLDEHAPETARRLGPPAVDAELSAAREAAGDPLPDDLIDWWRLSNGNVETLSTRLAWLIPGHFAPYRIDSALNARSVWMKVWHDDTIERGWLTEEAVIRMQARPPGSQAGAWLPQFLPIAGSGGGMDLFADLREGPLYGCVREFDRVYADGKPLWPSVGAMLDDIAGALESGDAIAGGYRVHVDEDGTIRWERDLTGRR